MRVCTDTLKLISKMTHLDKRTGEQKPIILWPKQHEYLNLLHTEKFISFLKRRQVFGTILTGADTLCQAEIISGFLTILLSKSGPDAVEFLKKIKTLYKSLPKEIKKALPWITKDTQEELEFENGSRIVSLPANRGEGFTGDRLVIDEAARIIPSLSHTTLDRVLLDIEPVIRQADGQIILVSKASGFNQFRQYYQKGRNRVGIMRSFFLGAFDDPNFTPEMRAALIEEHGEDHVNENYPRTPDEAFVMSGRCKFNRPAIEKMRAHQIEGRVGYLTYTSDNKIIFKEDPDGWMRMFKAPVKGLSYCIGDDVSEGVEKDEQNHKCDYSAAQVLNVRTLEQVAEVHHRLPPAQHAYELKKLHQYYNRACIAVENNKQEGVLIELKRLGVTNLYFQEKLLEDIQVFSKKLGWNTNSKTKPVMVEHGDRCLRESLAIVHSPDLMAEFVSFVKFADGTCGAQEGCYDDLVMAWLIALQVAQSQPADVDQENEEQAEERSWENSQEYQNQLRNKQLAGAGYFGR